MNVLKDRKHYIIYGLLIIGIIWAICRDKNGRYELATGNGEVYVLDTRTSQLWIRYEDVPSVGTIRRWNLANINFGTNQNPKIEKIEED